MTLHEVLARVVPRQHLLPWFGGFVFVCVCLRLNLFGFVWGLEFGIWGWGVGAAGLGVGVWGVGV